jgi:hypothetical protein
LFSAAGSWTVALWLWERHFNNEPQESLDSCLYSCL